MRLKSFYANNMTDAMKMVRDTLGEDAVIVATREEKQGKTVRVTAAIDPADNYTDYADEPFSLGAGPNFELETVSEPADAEGWLQHDEDDESAVVEHLTDVMLRHSVPEEITDQIISCATVLGMERADQSLMAAIEHLFSFKPLPQKVTSTAYMMIGAPGAGKTLAVAKLAARSVMSGMRTAVISTDTVRAGGIEQLEAFTKLLKINLQRAASYEQLTECLERAQKADQIFIDTGGMNPYDQSEMRALAQMIGVGDIEPVLVMQAGIDADESAELARSFGALGVRYLLPTRLDFARRLGGVLSAAHSGGLIFADASHTPQVANGLIQLSPKRLTSLLMPETIKKQESLRTQPHKSLTGSER
jgi:flagellar biosynthesis protein FlhF